MIFEEFYIYLCMQWRIQDFPEVRVPTLAGEATYDFAKCFQKLHEIERISTRGYVSLAPPRSATGMVRNVIKKLLKIFNWKCIWFPLNKLQDWDKRWRVVPVEIKFSIPCNIQGNALGLCLQLMLMRIVYYSRNNMLTTTWYPTEILSTQLTTSCLICCLDYAIIIVIRNGTNLHWGKWNAVARWPIPLLNWLRCCLMAASVKSILNFCLSNWDLSSLDHQTWDPCCWRVSVVAICCVICYLFPLTIGFPGFLGNC